MRVLAEVKHKCETTCLDNESHGDFKKVRGHKSSKASLKSCFYFILCMCTLFMLCILKKKKKRTIIYFIQIVQYHVGSVLV